MQIDDRYYNWLELTVDQARNIETDPQPLFDKLDEAQAHVFSNEKPVFYLVIRITH